jgi:hypothetical protein
LAPKNEGEVQPKLGTGLHVGGELIQQSSLKEKAPKGTELVVLYKLEEWTNDGESHLFGSWEYAIWAANLENRLDQAIYLALLNLKTAWVGEDTGIALEPDEEPQPAKKGGSTAQSKHTPKSTSTKAPNKQPTKTPSDAKGAKQGEEPKAAKAMGSSAGHGVISLVMATLYRLQTVYRAACRGSAQNTFRYFGIDFFVDQDANYIYPLKEVQRDGIENKNGRILAKNRKLGTDYDYTHQKLSLGTIRTILGLFMKGEDQKAESWIDPANLCMFLASLVAEPGRNPVAHVTNLMILAGLVPDTAEGTEVLDIMPMTKGGTAKPGEKLSEQAAAMREHRSQKSGVMTAPKASTFEIRLIKAIIGDKLLNEILALIRLGKDAEAVLRLQQHLQGATLERLSKLFG